MNLKNDEIAIILLTSYLALTDKEVKPYSLSEWNKLAKKIASSSILRPGNLLSLDILEIKKFLLLENNEVERMKRLLERGTLLSIELEALFSKGIKILTRGSSNYPIRLKQVLRQQAPTVIFYCGNINLLNNKGIAIVGSRKVNEDILNDTKKVARIAAKEGFNICSGGAKGVDSIAETEAFIKGGSYISFITDSLEVRIKKKDVRDRLSSGRVLLLTAQKPNVGFSRGAAMGRNKYIYGLSNGAFIMNSDFDKGGTWTGAVENLKHDWVKSFVIDSNSKGNKELIKKGCVGIKDIDSLSIKNLLLEASIEGEKTEEEQIMLPMDVVTNKLNINLKNDEKIKEINSNLNLEENKEYEIKVSDKKEHSNLKEKLLGECKVNNKEENFEVEKTKENIKASEITEKEDKKELILNEVKDTNIDNEKKLVQVDEVEQNKKILEETIKELDENIIKEKEVDNIKETFENVDAYKYLVDLMVYVLKEEQTLEEFAQNINVNKKQASEWLKRLIEDKKVIKKQKPVRYVNLNE